MAGYADVFAFAEFPAKVRSDRNGYAPPLRRGADVSSSYKSNYFRLGPDGILSAGLGDGEEAPHGVAATPS
jgi:hypothetical protein